MIQKTLRTAVAILLMLSISSAFAKKKLMTVTDKMKEDIAKAIPKEFAKPKAKRRFNICRQ
jgi:hypothetical protein